MTAGVRSGILNRFHAAMEFTFTKWGWNAKTRNTDSGKIMYHYTELWLESQNGEIS
jgi:hypothetical protein